LDRLLSTWTQKTLLDPSSGSALQTEGVDLAAAVAGTVIEGVGSATPL
jgi:hypothetical protein